VLEALSSTCTLYTQSNIGLMQLLSDMLVAFLLITAHGSVLMCQVGLGSGVCRVEGEGAQSLGLRVRDTKRSMGPSS
jgi:hypothetical protein